MLCSQPANFRDWHHITTKAKAIAKLQAFERGDDVVDEHQSTSGSLRAAAVATSSEVFRSIGPSLRLQRAGRCHPKRSCRARCGGCASAASNCAVTPLPTCSQAHSDPGRGKGQGGHIYPIREGRFCGPRVAVGASFSRQPPGGETCRESPISA